MGVVWLLRKSSRSDHPDRLSALWRRRRVQPAAALAPPRPARRACERTPAGVCCSEHAGRFRLQIWAMTVTYTLARRSQNGRERVCARSRPQLWTLLLLRLAHARDHAEGNETMQGLLAVANIKLNALSEMDELVWHGRDFLTPTYGAALAELVSQAPHLRSLNLGWTKLGAQGATAFATLLPNGSLPRLEVLALDAVGLDFDAADALGNAFSRGAMANLSQLKITQNPQMGAAGIVALLRSPPRGLRLLKMNDNKLGDAGFVGVANAISNGVLPELLTLKCDECEVGDYGLVAFSEALWKHRTAAQQMNASVPVLTELSLNENEFNTTGVSAFAEAVRRGGLQQLRTLSFSGTALGNKGAQALALAITHQTLQALDKLSLNNCGIGSSGAAVLAAAFKRSGSLPALETLTLSSNSFAFVDVFAEVLDSKALPRLEDLYLRPAPAGGVAQASQESRDGVTQQRQHNETALKEACRRRKILLHY